MIRAFHSVQLRMWLPHLDRSFGTILLLATAVYPWGVASASAQVLVQTGNMNVGRVRHTLTRLADGRVLAAGAGGESFNENVTSSAEIYDSATGKWTLTGFMGTDRGFHVAALLKNGQVLVAGGDSDVTPSPYLNSAEIWNPTTGLWTPTGSMTTPRHFFSGERLTDGRVLVIGGLPQTQTAEIFDPNTGRWSRTGSLNFGRWVHKSALLADGRVLVTGGRDTPPGSTEIYDPAADMWSVTGSVPYAPGDEYTLTTLPDGRVLLAGGTGGQAKAALYDPASEQWIQTPDMPGPRIGHNATLLLDGTVLIAGGGSGLLRFEPDSQTWTASAGDIGVRSPAVRLLDGRVLVAGGSTAPVANSLTQAFLVTGGSNTVVPILTLDVTAPSILAVVNGSYSGNPFTINARVRNGGAATATNVTASLSLPGGLTFVSGSIIQTIGDLAAGAFEDVTWTVGAAGQRQQLTLSYFVSAESSTGTGNTLARQITLPGGTLTINSISPRVGGDTGSVTLEVNGGGIREGAKVKLVRDGEPDVAATSASIAGDGFSGSATFDLTGRTRGLWSVVVGNPDGTTATLMDIFTVEAGRTASVWTEIIGPSAVVSGRSATFYILYGNRGNINAQLPSLWLSLPAGSSWRLLRDLVPRLVVTSLQGDILLAVEVPVLSGGGSGLVAVTVITSGPSFKLGAWTRSP